MGRSVVEKMRELAELQWLQAVARLASVAATMIGLPILIWMVSTTVELERESAVRHVRLAQIEREVGQISTARQRDGEAAVSGRAELVELRAEVRGLRTDVTRLVQLVDAQYRAVGPSGGR